jgi:peptidoglycan/LPS O-acetylase OafA/YrhL
MAAPPTTNDVLQPRVTSPHSIAVAPERNLDLLRAIAVLLVVICHLFGVSERTRRMPLPHELGNTGVLMFFVHTSLVLMLSIQRMKGFGGMGLVWAFYVRRVFRIYPLSIVTVGLVFWLRIPEQALAVFKSPSRIEWLANLLLMQNLARCRSAIAPLWSLPWEVQMYLALPIIFIALNSIRHRARVVALASVLAALLSVSGWHVIFKLLAFTPCFLGGVLAYVLLRSRAFLCGKLWPAGLLLLVSGYLILRLWVSPQGDYPAWLMCTILGIAIPQFRDLRAGWLTNTTHCIAKYSYGVYLAHVPVIWLAFDHFRNLPFLASVLIFVVGAAGLPFAAYHLIEAPMIAFGRRLSFSQSVSPNARPTTGAAVIVRKPEGP